MPRVPFKDSDGRTIKESRRKIPDRRAGNIQVAWTDMRTWPVCCSQPALSLLPVIRIRSGRTTIWKFPGRQIIRGRAGTS